MGVVNAGTPFLDRSPGVVCLARSVLATVMSIGSVVSSSSSDSYVSVCIGIRSSYPGLREMKLIIIPSLSLYFPLLSLSRKISLVQSLQYNNRHMGSICIREISISQQNKYCTHWQMSCKNTPPSSCHSLEGSKYNTLFISYAKQMNAFYSFSIASFTLPTNDLYATHTVQMNPLV